MCALGPELEPFGETMKRLIPTQPTPTTTNPLTTRLSHATPLPFLKKKLKLKNKNIRCEGLRNELESSQNVLARVEGLNFIQNLAIFAPQTVQIEKEMMAVCLNYY